MLPTWTLPTGREQNMKRSGAQITIDLLQREGIDVLTGIPGGSNLPLYDALGKSSIQSILARHEQGAGFIAHGMARSTGKPAVVFATSGPGATNLVTPLADAMMDSVPIIAITGQVSSNLIGTDAFQEVDITGICIPVTRSARLVRSAKELFDVIPEAFAIATLGRPGPVLIDIPRDVQTEILEFDAYPEPGSARAQRENRTGFRISEDSIKKANDLFQKAQRPLLFIGGGMRSRSKASLLEQFATNHRIPVVSSLTGNGSFPPNHPLRGGMVGMHGPVLANELMEHCDLLIAIGVRFDDRATGKLVHFAENAALIHVDIDPAELGKLKKPELSICGDGEDFLQKAIAGFQFVPRKQWELLFSQLKNAHPMAFDGQHDLNRPAGILSVLSSLLPDSAIVTTDVGQHQMWAAQVMNHRHPDSFLTSGGLGTMGFGIPAAIGAAFANPERQVYAITGDGSIFMNIQELATLAELELPVKILLLDNGQLGMVKQQQELFMEGRITNSVYKRPVSYDRVLQSFGIDVILNQDRKEALQELVHGRGPSFLSLKIDQKEMVFPAVPPGKANRESIRSAREIHRLKR